MRERFAFLSDESHTGIRVVRVVTAFVHRSILERVDRLVLHTLSLFANTMLLTSFGRPTIVEWDRLGGNDFSQSRYRHNVALLKLCLARVGYTSGPIFRASINSRGGPLSY